MTVFGNSSGSCIAQNIVATATTTATTATILHFLLDLLLPPGPELEIANRGHHAMEILRVPKPTRF